MSQKERQKIAFAIRKIQFDCIGIKLIRPRKILRGRNKFYLIYLIQLTEL